MIVGVFTLIFVIFFYFFLVFVRFRPRNPPGLIKAVKSLSHTFYLFLSSIFLLINCFYFAHTHTHLTRTPAHTRVYTPANTHSHTYICTHMCTHLHTYTYTHTCTPAHTHTHRVFFPQVLLPGMPTCPSLVVLAPRLGDSTLRYSGR